MRYIIPIIVIVIVLCTAVLAEEPMPPNQLNLKYQDALDKAIYIGRMSAQAIEEINLALGLDRDSGIDDTGLVPEPLRHTTGTGLDCSDPASIRTIPQYACECLTSKTADGNAKHEAAKVFTGDPDLKRVMVFENNWIMGEAQAKCGGAEFVHVSPDTATGTMYGYIAQGSRAGKCFLVRDVYGLKVIGANNIQNRDTVKVDSNLVYIWTDSEDNFPQHIINTCLDVASKSSFGSLVNVARLSATGDQEIYAITHTIPQSSVVIEVGGAQVQKVKLGDEIILKFTIQKKVVERTGAGEVIKVDASNPQTMALTAPGDLRDLGENDYFTVEIQQVQDTQVSKQISYTLKPKLADTTYTSQETKTQVVNTNLAIKIPVDLTDVKILNTDTPQVKLDKLANQMDALITSFQKVQTQEELDRLIDRKAELQTQLEEIKKELKASP
ncbi:MAG: hypothetical protein ABH879_09130 [archaeon]